MAYSTPSDVRRFAHISEQIVSDTEINEYISDADAQINQEIGTFTEPAPRRIKLLDAQ